MIFELFADKVKDYRLLGVQFGCPVLGLVKELAKDRISEGTAS